MKKRIERKDSDSSSSVGFFPKSFDDSESSKSFSNTSDSDVSADMFEFVQNNPVKINCWRENICSDLDAFARDKLLESANHAPHPSPKKKAYNSKLITANNTAAIETNLKHALYFFTPQGQELHKLNQNIISVDTQSGRSYQKLMNASRKFLDLLELKGVGNCELLFEKYGVQNALELAQNIKIIPPVMLLMFLFLIEKYPTAPQDAIMTYFKKCQQEERSDCYAAFKFLDNYCYERFPTKNTMDNYMEQEHFTPSVFFSK